jgi:RsmE family RNA methyltransferase
LNLILLEPHETDANGAARLVGPRARHLLAVLKVTLHQQIRVGVVDGPIGTATVTALADDAVDVRCVFDERPPVPRVDLLLALPRPKVLQRLWAQVAALGVGRIILTNAARVERHYFDTHVLDPQVYRPLLIEGLQQARDTLVPHVTIHRQFRVLVEDQLDALVGRATRLVAHPAAADPIALLAGAERHERVLLAVGPEGGWNTFELDLLATHGFRGVGLGPRTLRSDTACVALLAVVHHALRLPR